MATSRTSQAPCPSSALQGEAFARRELPAPDEVSPGLWSVPMEMPNDYLQFNFCYVMFSTDGSVHVIDPGWATESNWQRLSTFLSDRKSDISDVTSITATHLHPDHSGQVERLRDVTSAPFATGDIEFAAAQALATQRPDPLPLDEWGVPADRHAELRALESGKYPAIPVPDIQLRDGDALAIPGKQFIALRTGGHTPGHLSFTLPEDRVVLTGDTLLPVTHPGLGLGGPSSINPIQDYFDGLNAIAALDGYEAAPGHEYRFQNLAERCATTAAHHLRRTREVAQALESLKSPTLWEIAETLTWGPGWENLRNFYLRSGLTQTAMHRDFILSGDADRYL